MATVTARSPTQQAGCPSEADRSAGGTVERIADVPGERAVAGKALASSTAWTEEEHLEICRGCAEVGLFTFLRSRDVLQAHGQAVLNGLTDETKERRTPAQRATDLAHDHQRHASQRVPGTLERRHRQTLLLCSLERDPVGPK